MSNQFAPKPNSPNVPPATSGKAIAALVLGILSLGFSCLTAIPALIVGFLAIGDINRSRGQLGGKGLAITGIVVSLVMPVISIAVGGILVALLLPAIQAARGAARTVSQENNMRQIGLAMHNYHDVHRSFPYAGTDEVPMSWRVSLLPYLEEQPLYEQFDFNQPADAPVNEAAAAYMPAVYGTLLFEHGSDRSPLQVPIGPLAANQPPARGQTPSLQSLESPSDTARPARFADLLDGSSNTAAVVLVRPEAINARWTRTEADYEVDLTDPAAGLFRTAEGTYLILMADGSVQQVDARIDRQTLSNLMTRDDGQVVDF